MPNRKFCHYFKKKQILVAKFFFFFDIVTENSTPIFFVSAISFSNQILDYACSYQRAVNWRLSTKKVAKRSNSIPTNVIVFIHTELSLVRHLNRSKLSRTSIFINHKSNTFLLFIISPDILVDISFCIQLVNTCYFWIGSYYAEIQRKVKHYFLRYSLLSLST